jgi:U3 small nucleolar RNA-associated protein 23
MDLVGGLERTLHGTVKPSRSSLVLTQGRSSVLTPSVITQCCMRHLYASTSEPGMSFIIDKAKLFERRRCNHLPEEYPEPLSAVECISSVVDPKGSKTNKNRYVIASQEQDVRKAMRRVMGVPLVYINRSVMIMEPMAGATAQNRDKEERGKFRDGLKRGSGSQGMKRKRTDGDNDAETTGEVEGEVATKKKKIYGKGPKGPNPLAVKKSKKRVDGEAGVPSTSKESSSQKSLAVESSVADGVSESGVKRKRPRKHKTGKQPEAVVSGEPGSDD